MKNVFYSPARYQRFPRLLVQPRWTFLLLFILMAGSSVVMAQHQPVENRTVRGVVLDEEAQPLIGANVYVKGTTTGTATNADGAFTLSVAHDAILVFSYIGYKPKEIAVSADLPDKITVALELFDNITGEPLIGAAEPRD